MSTEDVISMSLQSAGLFLFVWIIFRLAPSIPANAKAWTWRIALLKPLIGLLPLAVVSLHILPAPSQNLAATETFSPVISGAATTGVPGPAPSDNSPNPILIVWVLGSVYVAGRGIRQRRRAFQIARNAVPAPCAVLQDFLSELVPYAAAGKATRTVRLLASPEAQTAMLVGGLSPAIVLPESALDEASQSDAQLMIAHELAHHLRRDLGWLSLAWVVQSVFFFNPAVWLAVWAMQEAHESATDDHAIQLANTSAPRYAEMLVRTLVSVRPALVPGAAYMSGSYRSIHRRLEAMKHFSSPFNPRRRAAFGALALAVACLMPAYRLAQASPAQEPPTQKSTNPTGFAGQVPGDEPWFWVAPLDPSLPDNLSCGFNHYDVRQALVKVLQRSNKSYRIDPKVHGIITASFQNVTLDAGLFNLARQVGASFTVEKGVYVFTNRPPVIPPVAPPRPGVVVYKDCSISTEFKNADVREALRTLFRMSERSYSIDVGVQGTVTVKLDDVSFEEALKLVLRPIKGAFHVQDSVYFVTPAVKPPQ